MRLIRTLGSFILAGALSTQAASIVTRHGALKVLGGEVVDQQGNPLQLTGMSMYWDQWAAGTFNKAIIDSVVSNWQVSVLRVPLGITDSTSQIVTGGYPGDSGFAIRRVITAIDAAISDGIYVIIDWHDYDAVVNIPHAKAFFAMMAKKYGDIPNVAFEIWNEPSYGVYVWQDISSYADSVIPVIRKYSPNLIIVGTANSSQILSDPLASPITSDPLNNIAYTFHFYACSHPTTLISSVTNPSTQAPAIPIFVTEWGTTDFNGGGTDTNTCLTSPLPKPPASAKLSKYPGSSATDWFKLLDLHKISSCNWSLNAASEASAALRSGASLTGVWAASDLSPSGTWVRNNIRAHCTADPTVCPYEGAFAAPPVLAVPGTIPGASFAVTDGIMTEATQEASGGQDLSSIDSGDFVSYSVNAASADTLWLQARVADVSGGLIVVQLDGLTADSIRVYPTGGVQAWSWADGARLIPIAAGAHTLTLRFNGSGRDLLRLQRLEVVSKRVVATPVPSQISLDDFNGPLVGLGLGPIFEAGGPSLRHATTHSKALYKVSAAVADSLPLSIVAANGSPDPASVVVWKKGLLTYAPFDTLVVAPSGWTSWQTLMLSRNIPLDTGANYLEFTFLGDTGTALVDLGALSVGTVVTAVQPQTARHGAVSLRRDGQTLHVGLPDGGVASVELLSADGRIWAQRTLVGSGSLPVPRTRQSLWLRVRGQSSAVLAVPPGF